MNLIFVMEVLSGALRHPKITLLVGAKKGRLLIGSANLTALGLGGNRELVASLSYDEDATGNAYHFAAALNYIRSKVPSDDLWFATAMQRALRSSPWLRVAMDPPFPEKEAEHGLTELKRQPSVVDAEILEDRNWLEPGLFEALLSTAADDTAEK